MGFPQLEIKVLPLQVVVLTRMQYLSNGAGEREERYSDGGTSLQFIYFYVLLACAQIPTSFFTRSGGTICLLTLSHI